MKLLFVHPLLQTLPDDGEQHTLCSIGNNAGVQTTEEQTMHPILLNDHFHGLLIGYLGFTGLFGGLDNTDTIGSDVGHHG